MKKITSFLFIFICAITMNSSLLAQGKITEIQTNSVEGTNLSIFSVKKFNLMEKGVGLQFQFSIANKSKQISPGVEVVLSAYNKSNNLKARHTRRIIEQIPTNTTLFSLFDVNSELKGGYRYTVEFFTPQQTNSLDGECDSCTSNAIRACGQGKVKSVSCTLGPNGTYDCSYSCSDKEDLEF